MARHSLEIVKQRGLKNQSQKSTCMECNKYTRKFRSYKDMYLCYQCYIKKVNMIEDWGNQKTRKTLKQALDKTYEIKGYLSISGRIHSAIQFPQILIGHKVKLVLVDEDK